MEDIAAQAGVSKPILYRHFADRADLWLAVGRRVNDELLAAMSSALLGRPAAARRRSRRSSTPTSRSSRRTPRSTGSSSTASLADRGMSSDLVHAQMALMAAEVARVLGDRLREAGVDSGGAEPWAHGIVGMVQAAADWWIDRRSMSRAALVAYLTR